MNLSRKLDRLRAQVRTWSDLILLGRIALLVMVLPGLLRHFSLPELLHRLTPRSNHDWPETAAAERIVHLTDLVLRRMPVDRKTCLVRSLVLYRLLRIQGMPVRIHFGVQHADSYLAGHSWLTCLGREVAQTAGGAGFAQVYAYPAEMNRKPDEDQREPLPCVWPG